MYWPKYIEVTVWRASLDEATATSVWHLTKEVVPLLTAVTSSSPKGKARLVMQPIRFFFLPKMELFITSAARKKFVHRVTVFLFYFVSYVLLFLVLFMNGIWILIDYFRCQNFSSDAPTFSQLTPTSLRCYSPSRLDPLRFSFFGERSLCTCTNIFRERKH